MTLLQAQGAACSGEVGEAGKAGKCSPLCLMWNEKFTEVKTFEKSRAVQRTASVKIHLGHGFVLVRAADAQGGEGSCWAVIAAY